MLTATDGSLQVAMKVIVHDKNCFGRGVKVKV